MMSSGKGKDNGSGNGSGNVSGKKKRQKAVANGERQWQRTQRVERKGKVQSG